MPACATPGAESGRRAIACVHGPVGAGVGVGPLAAPPAQAVIVVAHATSASAQARRLQVTQATL